MIKTKNIYTIVVIILFVFLFCASATQKAYLGEHYTYSYKLIGDNVKSERNFNDGKIDVDFYITSKDVNFTLRNLTKEPMKINWDEGSLIIFGSSKRIIHKGVKLIDRSNPQAPTVIPPNSSIDDLASPADNIYYREGYYSQYTSSPGGWEAHDLFTSNDLKQADTKKFILGLKGTKFQLFLPIEQNGQKLNYTFEFEIKDVAADSQLKSGKSKSSKKKG